MIFWYLVLIEWENENIIIKDLFDPFSKINFFIFKNKKLKNMFDNILILSLSMM